MKISIQGESFEVDPSKIRFGEAKRIEATTGMTFGQWGQQLSAGSITALQALVWTLMRRSRPEVRFDDIDDIEFGDVVLDVEDSDDATAPVSAVRSRPTDPTLAA